MKKSFAYQQKVRKDLRKGFRIEYLGQLRKNARRKGKTEFKKGRCCKFREVKVKIKTGSFFKTY